MEQIRGTSKRPWLKLKVRSLLMYEEIELGSTGRPSFLYSAI